MLSSIEIKELHTGPFIDQSVQWWSNRLTDWKVIRNSTDNMSLSKFNCDEAVSVYFFNILIMYHEVIKRLCMYRVIMLLIRGVSFIAVLSTAAATGYPGGCRLSVR